MRTKKRTVKGSVRSYLSDDDRSDRDPKSATVEVCVETFSEDIHRACLDAVPVKVTMTWEVPTILDKLEELMGEWTSDRSWGWTCQQRPRLTHCWLARTFSQNSRRRNAGVAWSSQASQSRVTDSRCSVLTGPTHVACASWEE